MAKINYDFYDGKDIYNDGKIEQELYEYYKNDKTIDFTRDDIFYLTTPIRENIISWYPFKKNSKVLEVGAGLGTITGTLCNNVDKVVAVEGSERRANILYERHKDKENLEVYVGNYGDIQFSEKFDYIVLIGVFEYSKIFFSTDNPFNDFLEALKKNLNENGKIIIAIENRYGIKYWAGNNEDHLGKPYLGLYGYDNENVQTFGKNELIEIFENSGIKDYKFYYPFPDYKMPQVIYTDKYQPSDFELECLPIYNFSYENYTFFPQKVLKGLRDNNMFGFYSNSFLIELGMNSKNFSNVAYAKYQSHRRKKFNTITIITDDNKIYKKSDNNQANNHLDNMIKIHEEIKKNKIKTCNVIKKDNIYEIERLEGITLENLILKNLDEVESIIEEYVDFVHNCSTKKIIKNHIIPEVEKVYKETKNYVLNIGLLDFNLGNVIKNNNEFYVFDQEWKTDYDIPADYVIYFSLKLLIEKSPLLTKKININKLYKKYNITKEKRNLFDKISYNYFNNINDVNDKNILNKLFTHKQIIIDNEKECLKNDVEFYKDLIEKTKSGYETEINRLNELEKKYQIEINILQEAGKGYQKEINRLNEEYQKELNIGIKEYIIRRIKGWKK